MIPFNKPVCLGTELEYVRQAVESGKLSAEGEFARKCSEEIRKLTGSKFAFLTTSCTHALEISSLVLGINPGDEVIMPSFTFVSTANAFVLRGAKIVFVDICPDTMNIDVEKIEKAISKKTKAILAVHYAGVSCDMNEILRLAKKYGIAVVEDAAQGLMSLYEGKSLGSMGDIGCFSFHDTKNYCMGEGGAIVTNDEEIFKLARIVSEKGTNRSLFFQGMVDRYTWVDEGSSYLPSELNSSYLYPQLLEAKKINENRRDTWSRYYDGLKGLAELKQIELPHVPFNCRHNAHIFYIKCESKKERISMTEYLLSKEISSCFHFVPLHNSEAGRKFGVFSGEDVYTTKESERLLRLPIYYKMKEEDCDCVISNVIEFYRF